MSANALTALASEAEWQVHEHSAALARTLRAHHACEGKLAAEERHAAGLATRLRQCFNETGNFNPELVAILRRELSSTKIASARLQEELAELGNRVEKTRTELAQARHRAKELDRVVSERRRQAQQNRSAAQHAALEELWLMKTHGVEHG